MGCSSACEAEFEKYVLELGGMPTVEVVPLHHHDEEGMQEMARKEGEKYWKELDELDDAFFLCHVRPGVFRDAVLKYGCSLHIMHGLHFDNMVEEIGH